MFGGIDGYALAEVVVKRYEVTVDGDPELVLDLLRSSFRDAGTDTFTLDAGYVPGTRFLTSRVEGRFVRVEGGIRVVAEAGASKTHTASTLAAGGFVLVALISNGSGGVTGFLLVASAAVLGLGVIYAYHQWSEAKAADHALRRLQKHLDEVRKWIEVHGPQREIP